MIRPLPGDVPSLSPLRFVARDVVMPYFSRLTDIVTCNLSSLLLQFDDPGSALAEILLEIEEGVRGARRSMKTAADNEQELRDQISEQQQEEARWEEQAKEKLASGDEQAARVALTRRREVAALIAGLSQNLQAATATREHLETTYRALEARLAEAQRRREALLGGGDVTSAVPQAATMSVDDGSPTDDSIEEELNRLKQQMGKG